MLVCIFIIATLIHGVSARSEYVGGIFYRTESGLDEVPSDISAEAIEVYLQFNRITQLNTGTFSHLTQCIKLYIHDNSITIIDGDAFTGMVQLQEIHLYRNKLTSLEKSMFSGLRSLTHLDIQSNLIETIPDGCFSDLKNLNGLYLGSNKLSAISGNMWLGPSVLKRLYLHNNNIATLKSGDLDHLPMLELLLLYDNPLTTLSHTIFNPSLYPETYGHPRRITMGLGLMKCNSSLCWLKQGEQKGWITWYTGGSGIVYHPDCLNLFLWSEDLNCPDNDECTTYIESQCQTRCESIGPLLGKFNGNSSCPCKCICPDFVQSDCEMQCHEEGKVVALGSPDQFGCVRCKCACPPYHNTSCQTQCTQEGKLHIEGAKSRFGCDICQCGCLNRDCDTECGDLEFLVTKGSQGCIVGCQCICADDCEPNCYGCIDEKDLSSTENSSDELDSEKMNTVNLALIVVGSLICGIILSCMVVFLCLKRKTITLFARRFGFRTNQTPPDKTETDQNTEPPQYEEITTGYVNQAGPSGTVEIVGKVTSPYINVPASGRTETEQM